MNENISKLKADKTFGIMKLNIKHLAYMKIINLLSVYRKIRLEKVSNILEIEKSLLLRYLKYLTTVIKTK